ncbi:MAG TPA: cytochrome c [Candidatus Acidoferrum sp.]|nr:cytochrome c [Candidatus Acidoferrum sp.]
MITAKIVLSAVGVVAVGVAVAVFAPPMVPDTPLPTGPEAIARGEYIFNAGGCAACHQEKDATGPSGGHELPAETPFGTNKFHVPNITPDKETGIAGWTGKDFLRALKHGRKPSGGFYWPAFPFRTYKNMTDQDVLDVGAYLMSLPAISNKVPPHELSPIQFSWMMAGWNILADVMEGTPPPFKSDDPKQQRGAYLARALGHCGECHTPRNKLGMMKLAEEFAGVDKGAPAINSEGIATWVEYDFSNLLTAGLTPDGDAVGGEMAKVVDHTKLLKPEDQAAYAAFFLRNNKPAASGGEGK